MIADIPERGRESRTSDLQVDLQVLAFKRCYKKNHMNHSDSMRVVTCPVQGIVKKQLPNLDLRDSPSKLYTFFSRFSIRTRNQSTRSPLSKQYALPIACRAWVAESLMVLAVARLRILFNFERQKNKDVVV